MSFKSIFESRFPTESHEEGFRLTQEIGNVMPPYEGYLDHEVTRDVKDAGHLQVVTRWKSLAAANAVLAEYGKSPTIQRVNQLHSGPRSGFIGEVVS